MRWRGNRARLPRLGHVDLLDGTPTVCRPGACVLRQITISRREALSGAGAAAAIAILPPIPALMAAPGLQAPVPPVAVASSIYDTAELAAELEEALDLYLRCEDNYDPTDLELVEIWKDSYAWLIYTADVVHDRIVPHGAAERTLLARARSIWPGEKQRARMLRPEITGNSCAFENLKRSWIARHKRYLDAQQAFHQVQIDGDQKEFYASCHRLSDASQKLRNVSRRICGMVPKTKGDRELFRRVKVQWAWREQAEFEHRHGIVNAGRKKHRYKAGHLIDPDRLSWG